MKTRKFEQKDFLWIGLVCVLAALPLLPGLVGNSFRAHVLILILLYASMAQSWNIVSGYAGQVSFGHSVFFGIGAYGAGMAVVTYGLTPGRASLPVPSLPRLFPSSSVTRASS